MRGNSAFLSFHCYLFGLTLYANGCAVVEKSLAQDHGSLIGGREALPGELDFVVWSDTLGCSGSVVSPHHLLLAGHCVSNRFEKMIFPGTDVQVGDRIGYSNDIYPGTGNYHTGRIKKISMYPGYGEGCELGCDVSYLPDVAVIEVEEDLAEVLELDAFGIGRVSSLGIREREIVTSAGYGCEEWETGALPMGRRKKMGSIRIDESRNGYALSSGKLDGTGAPVGCPGDSGGPMLNASGDIVAVNSFGKEPDKDSTIGISGGAVLAQGSMFYVAEFLMETGIELIEDVVGGFPENTQRQGSWLYKGMVANHSTDKELFSGYLFRGEEVNSYRARFSDDGRYRSARIRVSKGEDHEENDGRLSLEASCSAGRSTDMTCRYNEGDEMPCDEGVPLQELGSGVEIEVNCGSFDRFDSGEVFIHLTPTGNIARQYFSLAVEVL